MPGGRRSVRGIDAERREHRALALAPAAPDGASTRVPKIGPGRADLEGRRARRLALERPRRRNSPPDACTMATSPRSSRSSGSGALREHRVEDRRLERREQEARVRGDRAPMLLAAQQRRACSSVVAVAAEALGAEAVRHPVALQPLESAASAARSVSGVDFAHDDRGSDCPRS